MGSKELFREDVADLCHRQWSGWMDYMFSKASVSGDGSWTMPSELVERWKRQSSTGYGDLSASEKDSDRAEADKFIELFGKSGSGGKGINVQDWIRGHSAVLRP